MNIAIIGYGKMGKMIEQVAIQRGHTITLRITSANRHEMTSATLSTVDVAIEFTTPHTAKGNVITCLENSIPVVCGTTGWADGLPDAKWMAIEKCTSFLYASNFSIGVNIFFEINKLLAQLMNHQADYDIKIEETHHTEKKDSPSGTAITLAEQILENIARKEHWHTGSVNDAALIPIIAHREENVPGTHKITYSSSIDDIELTHTAHNRSGFALGAVMAAEYIRNKKGIFEMKDVLNTFINQA
jgi:4-hydroxy-tetrahydrodipicolinate reductase